MARENTAVFVLGWYITTPIDRGTESVFWALPCIFPLQHLIHLRTVIVLIPGFRIDTKREVFLHAFAKRTKLKRVLCRRKFVAKTDRIVKNIPNTQRRFTMSIIWKD